MEPDAVQGQNKRFECRLILLGALSLRDCKSCYSNRLWLRAVIFRGRSDIMETAKSQGQQPSKDVGYACLWVRNTNWCL